MARELGIACVVGTGNGTSALRTGDVVRVDGTSGEVAVRPEPERQENDCVERPVGPPAGCPRSRCARAAHGRRLDREPAVHPL
ncbi:PEP-utilizing enzyme [Mycolicibacterium duvalii]|uniref:PEP-utilizing enzyme n=1 Tax=Mycolicibacterium duvalii TaxID=39688 RepID=UPI001FD4870F|nr:PEP-utilizing enzyme [Mycolicibacterium duvalii]